MEILILMITATAMAIVMATVMVTIVPKVIASLQEFRLVDHVEVIMVPIEDPSHGGVIHVLHSQAFIPPDLLPDPPTHRR